MARIFKYQDQTWDDPGPEFSNEDVKRHLTAYFPELAQAEVTVTNRADGTQEVVFVKNAGKKGCPCGASLLTPADVLARLDGLQPLHVEAVALYIEVAAAGELSAAELADLQPRIEAATAELEAYMLSVTKVVARCLALKPLAATTLPTGF